MNDHQPRHVFISYVRENQDLVNRLCRELESHGVNVWLDRNSIKPGARWKDAIRGAIRHGDFFIACFSNEYTSKTKTYMNEELTIAIDELRQFASDREWFIPVLLSECDVPARKIGPGETLLDINWVPLYQDWDTGIQKILSVIKPTPPEIQNLISALRSEDRDVCERAAKALGEFGDPSAVPTLIEALKDTDKRIRLQAAQALGKIGSKSVLDLIKAIKEKDWFIDDQVSDALGNIGQEGSALVPDLIEALSEEDKRVRWFAARTLGKIGPIAKAAVPFLIKALKDNSDEYFCYLVVDALGEMGPDAEAAVPFLIEALKNKSVDWRSVEALGKIGLKAVPALIESLKDDNKYVRRFAALTLRFIGTEAQSAVPALIEALRDQNEYVRIFAVLALEKINTPEAQKALEEYKQKSK